MSPDRPGPPPSPSTIEGSGLRRPRVLVADDDADIRTVLEMVLSERFDVVCAETGAEVLALAEIAPPDVVLLDWTLPDVSGGEVIEKLRAMGPEQSRLPIVLVSGAASIRVIAARIGVVACPKPCDIDQLIAAIDRALDPSRDPQSM